jgi:hypothetical protein
MLLRSSFQSSLLNLLSRVACKTSEGNHQHVEQSLVDGFLEIMKCSNSQVTGPQTALARRVPGLWIHRMSDQEGAAFYACS